MIAPIAAYTTTHITPAEAPMGAAKGGPVGADFATKLGDALGGVEDAQKAADRTLELLGSGADVDLHGAMIALEKADISLRAMVSVRDRAIAAYEQLANMQL